MKISELLNMIRDQDLVLPEFNREYVWRRDQAKTLMDSLLLRYPVGALLFWKTDKSGGFKNIDKFPERSGTVQAILDGQQRLTTLYMIARDEIPPYYTESDIKMDPRDLCFNLETRELQYYQATKMQDNPRWHLLTECFTKPEKISIFEIAEQLAPDKQVAFALANKLNDNFNSLKNILDVDIPVQMIWAQLEVAIKIFDLVNSQGTKLTDADLALAHITGKWPIARREMKKKIDELSNKNFYFDLTFMTRALTTVVTRRALFEVIHSVKREELEAGWSILSKILDYLISVLPPRAFIHSTEDLNSTNVLIPLVAYLSLNNGKFPNEQSLKYAIYWLYAAHIWTRYTAQTDQRLEQDVAIIIREEMPWHSLLEQIIDQRGRIEVKASDFEGRDAQHPLYRMLYILAKAHGAVDWYNGAPLESTHGPSYKIHSHHIFPQSLLYKNGYDSENHLHRKVVNEIANRAFITATSHFGVGTSRPEDYLLEVEEHYSGALVNQFMTMNAEIYKLDKYPEFLKARRELIAHALNEYMNTLKQEPIVNTERPITEIIPLAEGSNLEFKSTLEWDVVRNESVKALHYSVLKSIAAFLNSAGGILLIGVENSGGIYGLEKDLSLVHDSLDEFKNKLSNIIADHLTKAIAPFYKIRFEQVEGKMICVIAVDKALDPVFLKDERGKSFYVRIGSTTRALDPEEIMNYIQNNWG